MKNGSNLFPILVLIGVILIGCGRTNKVDSLNDYAMHSIDLVNCFSITSESPIISSERTDSSIFITYENEDTLKLILKANDSSLNVELVHKSTKLPTSTTILKTIEIITGDAVPNDDAKVIETFLKEENSSTTITIDGMDICLEKSEGEFILRTK